LTALFNQVCNNYKILTCFFVVKYRAEKDKLISEVDRVLEILEPYKPLIELTKEFSKEDIALLIQVNKVYLNHKDKAKELVSEIKKNLDESHQ
jgi:hypothetical protein